MNRGERDSLPTTGDAAPPPTSPDAGDTLPPSTNPAGEEPNVAAQKDKKAISGPVSVLLPLALTAIVLHAMKYASSILNPVFLALFVTMAISPALYWLRGRGFRSGCASPWSSWSPWWRYRCSA
jgi:hypothetical protein